MVVSVEQVKVGIVAASEWFLMEDIEHGTVEILGYLTLLVSSPGPWSPLLTVAVTSSVMMTVGVPHHLTIRPGLGAPTPLTSVTMIQWQHAHTLQT